MDHGVNDKHFRITEVLQEYQQRLNGRPATPSHSRPSHAPSQGSTLLKSLLYASLESPYHPLIALVSLLRTQQPDQSHNSRALHCLITRG